MTNFALESESTGNNGMSVADIVARNARALSNGINAKDMYGAKTTYRQQYWMDNDIMEDAQDMVNNGMISSGEVVSYLACTKKGFVNGGVVIYFASRFRAQNAGQKIGSILRKYYGEGVKIAVDSTLHSRMVCEYS